MKIYTPNLKHSLRSLKKQIRHRDLVESVCSFGMKKSVLNSLKGLYVMAYINQVEALCDDERSGQHITVHAMEAFWEKAGCVTVFPESSEFLEFLCDAKMEISLADLDLEEFCIVRSFSWPKSFIWRDSKPTPCLAVLMSENKWAELTGDLHVTLINRYVRHADMRERYTKGFSGSYCSGASQRLVMLLVYEIPGGFSYLRVYEEEIDQYLETGCLDSFKDSSDQSMRNRPVEERVTFEVVIRMMIYMQTFPDKVICGYPDDVLGRLGKLPVPDIQPVHLKSPVVQKKGTHESPRTHMRRWHFRRYPIQPDGTRKKGSVFVHGSIVNENVDPRTVVS